jgi:hypothetical protein
MTFEDQNLAKKAAEGNVEAFAQLVRGHSGLVYRLATRILGVDEAQDASQEVGSGSGGTYLSSGVTALSAPSFTRSR